MVPPRIVAGGVLTHAPAKVAVLVFSGVGRKLSLRTMESLKGKKDWMKTFIQNEKSGTLFYSLSESPLEMASKVSVS